MINRPLRHIILPFLFLTLVLTSTAKERFYRNISDMGEFGDLTISTIYSDSTGYVWMGSDRGVLRCDGIHTRLIPLNVAGGDRPLFITSFSQLPGNKIAVGTRRGLIIINGRGIVSATDESPEITSLVKWSADTLLAGTVHGLMAYDSDGQAISFPRLPVANIYSPQAHIMCMAADEDGNIYLHTLTALYRLDRATRSFTMLYEQPSYSDRAIDMAVRDGRVWIAMMSSGLWVVDTDSGMASQVEINSPVVTSLSMSPDGLYVGTDGNGVFHIDTGTATIKDHITHQLNHVGSPASNQVYSVMVDNSGLLWIGYYQHGADYSVNNSGVFEVFNDPRVLNSRGIAIRTITHYGPLRALGTRDGLILIDSINNTTTTLRRPGLNSDMVIAVKGYRDRLYIGTYGGGMSVYDPVTQRVDKFDNGHEIPFNRGHVFSITVDSGDRLWLGTSNGLYCYNGNTLLHHFTSVNSIMPVGNVYEVMFDSRGRGWVCTENGVCIYDPSTGTLRDDAFPPGFVNNDKIRTVFEDSDHNLYFLPERGKVTVSSLDLDNITQINSPALEGADAKSIAEDANGCVWITTNRGIVRWNKKDEILKFGVADGLPSAQFIQCTPALERDNGCLWFGNSNGLIKLDTKRDPHNNAIDRPLQPTDVTADGNEGDVAVITRIDSTYYKISLDRFCANLTIDFSPFTFTSPDAITYEYSVNGGKTWQPIPYSMKVDIYNNFTVHDLELLVRPEGNSRLVTRVYVDMPLSFALKAIIGLGCIALLLIIYAIHVSIVHIKNKYAERRAAMMQPDPDEDPDADADKPKYRSNPLNDTDCARIMKLIDTIMERDKLYTDPDLKISQLATHAGISSHKLSQVFSQYVNKKFYDYVNQYRVKEFKKIATRGGASRFTLTAMAEKAGFSSRASFFRHFKDVEGISPGEFLKSLKK